MGEVAARLGLGDAYVVFGHTHRSGPLPGDDAGEWNRPPGAAARHGRPAVNTGSWTYDAIFLTRTPGESPYWPGNCVLVEDSGPPLLQRLLLDRSHDELAAAACGQAKPGVKHVARQRSSPSSSSASSPAVWRSCSSSA